MTRRNSKRPAGASDSAKPSLDIAFLTTLPGTTGLSANASQSAVRNNPFENFNLTQAGPPPPPRQPVTEPEKRQKGKRLAVPESDDDDDVETPAVDISELARNKVIEILAGHVDKTEWPDRTDAACYYCAHKFTTIPIRVPGRIRNGKFLGCTGNYCSFDCARMDVQRTGRNSSSKLSLLSNLQEKVVGGVYRPGPREPKLATPPMQALAYFGGYIQDIEEFRRSRVTLPPPKSSKSRTEIVELMKEKCVPSFCTVAHTQLEATDTFQTTSVRETSVRELVLRDRTKPLPGTNVSSQMGGFRTVHTKGAV